MYTLSCFAMAAGERREHWCFLEVKVPFSHCPKEEESIYSDSEAP